MKRLFLLLLFPALLSAQTTVPVNNAAWQAGLSPYTWFVSGSSYIQAVNPGAYYKVKFSGTSVAVTVDVSAMVSGSVSSKQYPQIAWSIDGGTQQAAQLTPSSSLVSLASGLAGGTHALVFTFLSSDAYTARWSGEMSIKIDNMVLDSGASLSAATLQPATMLFFGDSITEGAWVLGDHDDLTNYSLYEVGNGTYADYASDMGAEYGKVAFGGQSWTTTFNGDIPPMPDAWNYIFGTNPRTFSPAPTYVVVNMGTNDTAGAIPRDTITDWLTSLRAAVGTQTWIFLVIPFNQNQSADIAGSVQAYQASSGDARAALIDLSLQGYVDATAVPTYSYDGLHPNAAGHSALARLLWQAIQQVLNPSYGNALNGVTIAPGGQLQ